MYRSSLHSHSCVCGLFIDRFVRRLNPSMTAEVSQPNGVVSNHLDLNSNPKSGAAKKSRESERRRRRRKQKKNQKASKVKEAAGGEDSDASGDDTKENDDPLQVCFLSVFYFTLRKCLSVCGFRVMFS